MERNLYLTISDMAMRFYFFFGGLLLLAAKGFSQPHVKGGTPESLLPLEEATTSKHDYVNFDVLQLSVGHGYSTSRIGPQALAPSWSFQVVYPYAFFREKHIRIGKEPLYMTAGLRAGRNRLVWKDTAWSPNSDGVLEPARNNRMGKSALRASYIGVLVLPFMQLGRFDQWTLMAGPALDYNIEGVLINRTENQGRRQLSSSRQVSRFSVPLHFQVSRVMNRTKTMSAGAFGSYYGQRFRHGSLSHIDQLVFGLNGAIIL
ncbi:hypothetical protein H9Q13_06650 [Pontibacter sp. JH31]|uniref:Outer membrane protein beta-barrel domain-containing protein n=1 Tax=Pontibacter aquaedesilientis TaxID=2766980 RepID=A0ABR7XGV2_9BACT|nr:hypothetical protein [Pontibacter aquaedesilientis]MBD1396838.1 hypothetical protein [Pontibacter aquaedesilientis]